MLLPSYPCVFASKLQTDFVIKINYQKLSQVEQKLLVVIVVCSFAESSEQDSVGCCASALEPGSADKLLISEVFFVFRAFCSSSKKLAFFLPPILLESFSICNSSEREQRMLFNGARKVVW